MDSLRLLALLSCSFLLVDAGVITYHQVRQHHNPPQGTYVYDRNCFFSPAACVFINRDAALRSMVKVLDKNHPKVKELGLKDDDMLVAWLTK